MGLNDTAGSLRILLVEDSEYDVTIFRRAIEASRVADEVVHYIRAEDVLEHLGIERSMDPAALDHAKRRAASFDLLVTDHRLPGMTGLELCLELLAREVPLPLVLLTGVGTEHLAVDALKAGVNDYLIKDADYGYLDLLPVVLPEVVRRHQDRLARQQAEQALRESEQKFRSLVEQSVDGIIMMDGRGIIVEWNHSLEQTTGLRQAQVLGQLFWDVLFQLTPEERRTPELHERDKASLLRFFQAGQASNSYVLKERSIQRSDGTRRIIQGLFFSIRADRDFMVSGFFRDVTEHKQAEAQVLHLQRLLQNVTDSMPSTLITLDLAGRVLTWNPSAELLTGRSAAQVQGQLLWHACPELGRYRNLFEDVIRGGQIEHLHKESLTTETGLVYRDVSAFPLEADSTEGVVLRIDDVTRRVQMEEAMLQSAKMASTGRLAAGVAHEINNPLAAMMQSAQILQLALDPQHPRTRERLQACDVDPAGLERYLQARDLTEYLDGIRTVGKRAAKIISDLLSFSYQSPSRIVPHDLNALVKQTLNLAMTDYDLKETYVQDMEIVRELTPNLPQVVCNRSQIQQVVLNLLYNAMQAMAERGDQDKNYQPRLELRTSLAPDPSYVQLEVKDNGPGIADAVRDQLFEPFSTTREVGKGVGLGLWLCWSIVVEHHGGRIWAESTPVDAKEASKDSGSCFVVELPVASC